MHFFDKGQLELEHAVDCITRKEMDLPWAQNLHAYYCRRRHYLHAFNAYLPFTLERGIILSSKTFHYINILLGSQCLAQKLCRNLRDPQRIVFQKEPENKTASCLLIHSLIHLNVYYVSGIVLITKGTVLRTQRWTRQTKSLPSMSWAHIY